MSDNTIAEKIEAEKMKRYFFLFAPLLIMGCASKQTFLEKADAAGKAAAQECARFKSDPAIDPIRREIGTAIFGTSPAGSLYDQSKPSEEQKRAFQPYEEAVSKCITVRYIWAKNYGPPGYAEFEITLLNKAKSDRADLRDGIISFGEYNHRSIRRFIQAKDKWAELDKAASARTAHGNADIANVSTHSYQKERQDSEQFIFRSQQPNEPRPFSSWYSLTCMSRCTEQGWLYSSCQGQCSTLLIPDH